MARRRGFTGLRVDIGTCQLTEYDEDNFLAVHIDGYGDDGSPGALELHHPYGFLGRPDDPDADGGGGLIQYWLEGDKGQAIALEDVRIASDLPSVSKGSSCQYAAFGGFVLLDHATKTQTTYIPYATGKAHTIQTGVDSLGQSVISILHGEGTRISMVEKSVTVANASGSAYLEINDDGWILWGNGKCLGALDVGIASFPLAKAAEVAQALTAIATCLGSGTQTGGVLNGAAVAVPLIDAAVAALSTTMVKGF